MSSSNINIFYNKCYLNFINKVEIVPVVMDCFKFLAIALINLKQFLLKKY